jgi:uncharacterized protein YodC (DUF2158 family)
MKLAGYNNRGTAGVINRLGLLVSVWPLPSAGFEQANPTKGKIMSEKIFQVGDSVRFDCNGVIGPKMIVVGDSKKKIVCQWFIEGKEVWEASFLPANAQARG